MQCFGGMFVRVVFRLAGDWQKSPQFRKVHHPPRLPITDRFLICSSSWCLFIFDDLWNAVVCFLPPSLLIGKVWVHIHCKMHLTVGSGLGSCRLISVQPLIGSTIRAFSISSALWGLEVMCCIYWHSFYQTDHSTLRGWLQE